MHVALNADHIIHSLAIIVDELLDDLVVLRAEVVVVDEQRGVRARGAGELERVDRNGHLPEALHHLAHPVLEGIAGAKRVGGFVDHIPDAVRAQEARDAVGDARVAQSLDLVEVFGEPFGHAGAVVPDQRMPLRGDVMLLAPRRDEFAVVVLWRALRSLVAAPVECERSEVEDGGVLVAVLGGVLVGGVLPRKNIAPEQELVTRLPDLHCRAVDGVAIRVHDRHHEFAHAVFADTVLRAVHDPHSRHPLTE